MVPRTRKRHIAQRLAACFALGMTAATAVSASPSCPDAHAASPNVQRDLAYGPQPGQRLDVYRPAHATHAPILLMVHGGAWMLGDKASPAFVDGKVAHWTAAGAIVVSVDYRMQAPVDPKREAEDVARALAYVQREARGWGGDPHRVVLLGHSAGAHLVALLTAAPDIAEAQGAKPWAGTVALDSAAYDLVTLMRAPHFRFYDRVFGDDPALWQAMSPTLRVHAATPPMLLVCSSERRTSCPQARVFAQRAKAYGSRITVLPVAMTHQAINRDLGGDNAYTRQVDAAMQALGLPVATCAASPLPTDQVRRR